MLRVIIADDEPVIVKGLKKIISWEKYGMEIVGEANDGGELCEKVVREKPDIVVSDICMPEMTGLEFLSRLKEEKIETLVIFISGYQRFEYVQEAMRLGAVDYILKPVMKEAMEETLKKARLRLQNQERLGMFQDEKNELQKLLGKLNEGNEYKIEELYESFCSMGIDYQGKTFAGVCFYMDEEVKKSLEMENYKKMELIKFSAFNRIQNFFGEHKKGIPMKRDDECIYILCMIDPSEKECFISDYVAQAMEYVEQEMEIKLRAGVGTFSDRPTDLGYIYNSVKFAYEMRYFLDKEMICSDNVHKKYRYSFEDYEKLRGAVFDALVTRKPETMEKIGQCMELIKNLHYGNRYAVVNRCILFVGSLYDDLKRYGLGSDEEEIKQGEVMEKIRVSKNFCELKKEVLFYYEELLKRISDNAGLWNNPSIVQVVDYMKKHFETDINMHKMAEMACVTPVYFGALFKKTTGRNFKSFLTDIRMEEAKKLVITTDMKTYLIAEKVGYQNTKRFTEKFKEYYGSSPAEYKRKLNENK